MFILGESGSERGPLSGDTRSSSQFVGSSGGCQVQQEQLCSNPCREKVIEPDYAHWGAIAKPTPSRRRWSNSIRAAWLACWLAVAGALLGQGWLTGERPAAVLPLASTSTASAPASVTIESLLVGDRVMGEHSPGELIGETKVDPATWRLLRLRADVRSPDGVVDDIHVDRNNDSRPLFFVPDESPLAERAVYTFLAK